MIATFRESDASPKEEFLYHCAGADGYGSSSYIDAVVLRDHDSNSGWTSAADATLEERTYYCQHWRADVVARVTSGTAQVEQVRYREYSVPFCMSKGDADGDGDLNAGDTLDTDQIQTWISAPLYDVRGNLELDGDVDATDKTGAPAMAGTTKGWGKALSVPRGGTVRGMRVMNANQ